MSFNRETILKLDTAGLPQREERREAVRKQEQAQQQVRVDSAAAIQRGLRSYLDESYRKVHVERLKADPALAFFLLANRDPSSA